MGWKVGYQPFPCLRHERAGLHHVVCVHLWDKQPYNGKETHRIWKGGGGGGGGAGPFCSVIQRWFTTTSCTAMLWMTTMESDTH